MVGIGKAVGKLGGNLISGKVVEVAVGYLTSEEGRRQIVALGQAAGAAAKKGAARVNQKMPWSHDLEAEYRAIATAVEQVAVDIAAAAEDPMAPVDRWTARLQRINTAIPQAQAAIGGDELKRVKQIRKATKKLQAEIYAHTMGERPKVATRPRLGLSKGRKHKQT